MRPAAKRWSAVALLLGITGLCWLTLERYPDRIYSAYLEACRWMTAAGPVPTLPAQHLQRFAPGEKFVVLHTGAGEWIGKDGGWEPSIADIYWLEASLSQVSSLKATNWPTDSGIRIEHPERYFRQYVGIIRKGKRLIYVNAFCDVAPISYWRETLVRIMDGGTCCWQAFYDPTARKFTALLINGVA